MVERQPSKLNMPVRSRSLAPNPALYEKTFTKIVAILKNQLTLCSGFFKQGISFHALCGKV